MICPARLDLPPIPAPVPAPLALAIASGLCALEKPEPAALWPRAASGASCRCIIGGRWPEPVWKGRKAFHITVSVLQSAIIWYYEHFF